MEQLLSNHKPKMQTEEKEMAGLKWGKAEINSAPADRTKQ